MYRPRSSRANTVPKSRGQVFWLPARPTCRAFPSLRTVASCGVRPRSQRRVRDGLSPSSLFKPAGATHERRSLYQPPVAASRPRTRMSIAPSCGKQSVLLSSSSLVLVLRPRFAWRAGGKSRERGRGTRTIGGERRLHQDWESCPTGGNDTWSRFATQHALDGVIAPEGASSSPAEGASGLRARMPGLRAAGS